MNFFKLYKEKISFFLETSEFYINPLINIGLDVPFTTIYSCKNAYLILENIINDSKVSAIDKDFLSICYALAVTKFLIEKFMFSWELKGVYEQEYFLPMLITYNVNNSKLLKNPINITLRCLFSERKLDFNFYFWQISDISPIELSGMLNSR